MFAKIKKAAELKNLHLEKNLPFLLFRLRDWGGENELNQYISDLIKDKQGALILIKAFMGKVLSTAGNYNKIDKESLSKLCQLADIERKISEFTNEEITLLGDKEKEVIETFKNPKKEW